MRVEKSREVAGVHHCARIQLPSRGPVRMRCRRWDRRAGGWRWRAARAAFARRRLRAGAPTTKRCRRASEASAAAGFARRGGRASCRDWALLGGPPFHCRLCGATEADAWLDAVVFAHTLAGAVEGGTTPVASGRHRHRCRRWGSREGGQQQQRQGHHRSHQREQNVK